MKKDFLREARAVAELNTDSFVRGVQVQHFMKPETMNQPISYFPRP